MKMNEVLSIVNFSLVFYNQIIFSYSLVLESEDMDTLS